VSLAQLVKRERAARTIPSGEAHVFIWVDAVDETAGIDAEIQVLGRVAEAEAQIAAEKAVGRIGSRTQVQLVGWGGTESIINLIMARMESANPPALPSDLLHIMAGTGRMHARLASE
jgi:hypothetical protein